MKSYEKINYTIRPAKNIQRKMLCEAFRLVAPFQHIEGYRYIGFGSTFFSDFFLFHRNLGMRKMVSIEKEIIHKKRFLFNRPFGHIKMFFKESGSILPDLLKKKSPTVLWLDYDYALNSSILTDISYFVRNATSGSIFLATVDVNPKKFDEFKESDWPQKRYDELVKNIGEERVPFDIVGKDLAKWGLGKVSYRVMNSYVEDILMRENNAAKVKRVFKQLFNFHYQDGAKMLTFGGMIHDIGDEKKFDACGFRNLTFTKSGKVPFHIHVPNLTFKEVRRINEKIKLHNDNLITVPGVTKKDVKHYLRTYRWFPHFAEAEV